MITYKVTTKQYIHEKTTYTTYGIAAINNFDNSEIIKIEDIFSDHNKALLCADKFNRLSLSPLHLRDVIEDML